MQQSLFSVQDRVSFTAESRTCSFTAPWTVDVLTPRDRRSVFRKAKPVTWLCTWPTPVRLKIVLNSIQALLGQPGTGMIISSITSICLIKVSTSCRVLCHCLFCGQELSSQLPFRKFFGLLRSDRIVLSFGQSCSPLKSLKASY